MWSIALRSLRASSFRPALGEASSSRLPSAHTAFARQSMILGSSLHSSAVRRRQDDPVARTVQDNEMDGQEEEDVDDADDDPFPPQEGQSAFSMPAVSASEVLPSNFRAQPAEEPASRSSNPFAPAPFGNRTTPRGSLRTRPPHRLHVKTSRNNIIMTITTYDGDVLHRCSAGMLGFKHAARSTYDAAYRVAVFMFQEMGKSRLEWQMSSIEIIWNGFGQGRDAVYRALTSSEGTNVRNMITRTSDKTPIKIGGTRPKKRRML